MLPYVLSFGMGMLELVNNSSCSNPEYVDYNI